MTKFQSPSFTVPMAPRETEEEQKAREGYVKHPAGFWIKSKIDKELRAQLVPVECEYCGKSHGKGLSNYDASTLDDWAACKECFAQYIEGQEKMLIKLAIDVVINPHADVKETKSCMVFLQHRGAKRWVKKHWPDQYSVIYDD